MSDKHTVGGAAGSGRRLALVAGINSAPRSLLPPLRSARQAAEAIARVLVECCQFNLLEPPLLEERATSAANKKSHLESH